MKRIDFHIHTVKSALDAAFAFDLENLKRYVAETKLDAIAITNHNLFDGPQFAEISNALDIVVFPGIEVSLDCGHILVIADNKREDIFNEQAKKISDATKDRNTLALDDFLAIFGNLSEYLVIPHYEKSPAIKGDDFKRIEPYASCGEVDSAKKFLRAIKDESKLTPVLFSDARISTDMEVLPTRQTFIDCGELTLSALKLCLQDKGKVALSEAHGNKLFPIFEDGQLLSTGLNILLGGRSTGKTYTLEKIRVRHHQVHYIEQFSLVQQNEESYAQDFNDGVQKSRSLFIDSYLAGFKVVLNDVIAVDLRADDRAVEKYIKSLLDFATDANRKDTFSKAALFNESLFPLSDDSVLQALIGSVRQLIENVDYREVIARYVDLQNLKKLAIELILKLWEKKLEAKKHKFINGLVQDIKIQLGRRTAAVPIQDVDLYKVSLNKKKVERFTKIVKGLQNEAVISEESIQSFRVVAMKGEFSGAGEIRKASGVQTAFREAFDIYSEPYEYLQILLSNASLTRSELYKLFCKITYRILNKDGYEVSGGERSEFRLLQEIKDAQNYDILLIDEPESSFDNIFLRKEVNQIIRDISEIMPVVVVTHNNTVGASVGADYILFASKEKEADKIVYRLYSGYPSDRILHSVDGKEISHHEITMNTLEAGSDSYEQRRQSYEAIANR
ncbi:MAG: phosphotransferase [Candidatus Hydrogenedentes bacterium]|nr:phosphotransferase [Candidatus Hydrogenedentota bacterium]